jgi:hypothetical protein
MSCLCVSKHLLIGRPLVAGTAQRAIFIAMHKFPTLAVDVASADLELILNRRLALIIG